MQNNFNIVSLFSGAWWLDLWFHQAWFNTIWANEYDKTIWNTFESNFPHTVLDKRSITDIPWDIIPDCIWIIGWPPCQSWSEAWAWRGINDKRWELFFDYIRILQEKKPLFFFAENVSWILHPKHKKAFDVILNKFQSLGYNVSYHLLNANDYGVAQDRKRVIIVWYQNKMRKSFVPPKINTKKLTLKDIIWDLRNAKPAKDKNYANYPSDLYFPNHEYMTWWFSTIFMSRNRVRWWDEPSFTIQAWWRHAPIHPKAPKMKFIEQNKRIFEPWKEDLYRRLSVRECARIQSFPDDFLFMYKSITDGYKMVGNAVPVELARQLANVIYSDVSEYLQKSQNIKVTLTWQMYEYINTNTQIIK